MTAARRGRCRVTHTASGAPASAPKSSAPGASYHKRPSCSQRTTLSVNVARKALADYRAALALGGTRPLPELFSAGGIDFDFSSKTLGPLMEAMQNELVKLGG